MMAGRLLILILFCNPGQVFAQSDSVIISSQRIDREIGSREEAILRPLTPSEKITMVKNLLFDEILFNEAIKLELHLSDSEVRERLIGIMEYTYQPRVPEPKENELKDYYEANIADFNLVAQYSFDHLYFKYKPDMDLKELDKVRDWQELGDEYWVSSKISDKPLSEINVFLGEEVAEALKNANLNQWTGPVKSAAGYHFVRVTEFVEEIPRSYEEVSELVPGLWKETKRKELFEERMIQLLNQYVVDVPDEYKTLLKQN